MMTKKFEFEILKTSEGFIAVSSMEPLFCYTRKTMEEAVKDATETYLSWVRLFKNK